MNDAGNGVPADRNEFKRTGIFWSVRFAGAPGTLDDLRGVEYIACLLEHPGEEIHVLDLVHRVSRRTHPNSSAVARAIAGQPAEMGFAIADLRAGSSSADRAELERLRAALHDAEEDLAEAESNNDPERAAQCKATIQWIEDDITARYGRGGRPRRGDSAEQRARTAVYGAVRRAFAHIEQQHPALHQHLKQSVKQGHYFSYRPDPPTAWEL
jgi:non-specific serine/threonine protein kinase